MTVINRSVLVGYSAGAMFDIVNDIDRYHEFLPWCEKSRVIQRQDDWVDGELVVAKAGFHKSFTTRNRLDREHNRIEMTLVEGPFRHLQGEWHFQPLDELACQVSLRLEFELASRMATLTFGPVFKQISQTLVDAFKARAQQINGGK